MQRVDQGHYRRGERDTGGPGSRSSLTPCPLSHYSPSTLGFPASTDMDHENFYCLEFTPPVAFCSSRKKTKMVSNFPQNLDVGQGDPKSRGLLSSRVLPQGPRDGAMSALSGR